MPSKLFSRKIFYAFLHYVWVNGIPYGAIQIAGQNIWVASRSYRQVKVNIFAHKLPPVTVQTVEKRTIIQWF